jgi:hypothetical protein
MQQEAKQIPLYSIVAHNGKHWYVQTKKRTCVILVNENEYKEVSNETLLVGIVSPEQTAKHYLQNNKQ